ncbi:hypothetical protein [Algiphilus sp.]|uniref:hypothetical protein n=1 Tax=Algiphilus sp. TaxID=1872431 RepID=UPI003CCC1365
MDGLDLSCAASQCSIEHGAEMLNGTTLCADSRERDAGLKTSSFGAAGFFEADPLDDALFDKVATDGRIIIASPGASVGDIAYMLESIMGEYQPFGNQVGELASFQLSAGSQGDLIRGRLSHNGNETLNGSSAAQNLGAISASQKLYAGLAVLSASGSTPTLDVVVESDSSNDFTGSETERLAFTQADQQTAELLSLDGAVTDTWWRIRWTVSGTSPDFKFVAVLGIQ